MPPNTRTVGTNTASDHAPTGLFNVDPDNPGPKTTPTESSFYRVMHRKAAAQRPNQSSLAHLPHQQTVPILWLKPEQKYHTSLFIFFASFPECVPSTIELRFNSTDKSYTINGRGLIDPKAHDTYLLEEDDCFSLLTPLEKAKHLYKQALKNPALKDATNTALQQKLLQTLSDIKTCVVYFDQVYITIRPLFTNHYRHHLKNPDQTSEKTQVKVDLEVAYRRLVEDYQYKILRTFRKTYPHERREQLLIEFSKAARLLVKKARQKNPTIIDEQSLPCFAPIEQVVDGSKRVILGIFTPLRLWGDYHNGNPMRNPIRYIPVLSIREDNDNWGLPETGKNFRRIPPRLKKLTQDRKEKLIRDQHNTVSPSLF